MGEIVIGVACHKESELPDNELYLPIHVGAALANKPLEGLQRDDEGDNISEKNPNYCELTAQYWLWKNVDADYYGLCHYRRYMSFAPERFTNLSNDHRKQVIVESLDEYTKEKYYLERADEMRELIEQYDVVATEEQDLSRVYTPHGPKRSVYEHFAAHDRDLINVEDMDAMLSIVKERYPQYYPDLKEYIGKRYFRGFNCFVMKKALFFEMCEYEFSVLEELEKRVDLSTYDLMRTRIYGFMAEILYSGFVYHLRKTRRAKVYDAQMLFFLDTEKNERVVPVDNAIPVVVNMINAPSFMFEVTAKSMLGSLAQDKRYDLLILHNGINKFFKRHYLQLFAQHANVDVRFVDWEKTQRALYDVYDTPLHYPKCLLPWIFDCYTKAIILDWNILFEKDWSMLWEIDLGNCMLAAADDIEWQGEINDLYKENREYLDYYLGLKDFSQCFSTAVMVVDFEAIRKAHSRDSILAKAQEFPEPISDSELMNVVFEGEVKRLPQCWNVRVSTYWQFESIVGDAPLALNKEYKEASKDPVLVQYDPDDPWWLVGEDHEVEFWEIARSSSLYNYFLEQMVATHDAAGKRGRIREGKVRRKLDQYLPKGSKRRALLRKMFPHGSKQYVTVKNAVSHIVNR